MVDIENLDIKKAHKHLTDGDFSAVELTEAYLNRIKKQNSEIYAYLEIFKDAIDQAKKADELIKSGQATLLTGIPLAIKDNILIKGRTASAASKILENYKATYDATVIKKLKKEGAVFLGRTNMDEFAMGSSTENSGFGVTKNPVDLSRVPGGSSGGSVASVAMNGALGALGSDTGGSIRQPASFCGMVGLKTTYGSVSRYGLMAMGSSFDQIGPITKNVEDAEIIFESIKGQDKMDSTSYPDSIYLKNKQKGNKKKIIGVPTDLLKTKGINKAVLDNFNDSIEKFKKEGYEIKEVTLPNIKYSLAVYYIIMPAEASTNLSRFDGIRYGLSVSGEKLFDDYSKTRGEGFGEEVRRRIILGTHVLSAGYYDAYYNKAIIVRKLIEDDFKKAFKEVDVIITPTTPTPAFKIGEKSNDPLKMYLADIFTVPINLAGLPAISIPSGYEKQEGSDLPLGLQIVAPHFKEDILFEMGKVFEKISKSD